LESKGKVLMKPDVVIATSNLSKDRRLYTYPHLGFSTACSTSDFVGNIDSAFKYGSIEPKSLFRRFIFIHVEKRDDWVKTIDGFDSNRYLLSLKTGPNVDDYKLKSFDELLSYIMYIFMEHKNNQKHMVESVNKMYNEGVKFNMLPRNMVDYPIIMDNYGPKDTKDIYKFDSPMNVVTESDRCSNIWERKQDLRDYYDVINTYSTVSISDYFNNVFNFNEPFCKPANPTLFSYPGHIIRNHSSIMEPVIYDRINRVCLNFDGKVISLDDVEPYGGKLPNISMRLFTEFSSHKGRRSSSYKYFVLHCFEGFDLRIVDFDSYFNMHYKQLGYDITLIKDSVINQLKDYIASAQSHNIHEFEYETIESQSLEFIPFSISIVILLYITFIFIKISKSLFANVEELISLLRIIKSNTYASIMAIDEFRILTKCKLTDIELQLKTNSLELLESQAETTSILTDITSKLPKLWKQFYQPQKQKPVIIDQHVLRAITSVPLINNILIPEACGNYPCYAEEKLNLAAQSHFRELGWNIIAYECSFNGTSCDLLICRPNTDNSGPIIGVVECKIGSPDRTMSQVITRMQELEFNSVVGYAYSVNRITFFGSIDIRSPLSGIICKNDIPVTDTCSDHKTNGKSITHKRVLELRSSGQLGAQE